MRTAIRFGGFFVLWLAAASSARADPIVVTTTTIATSGRFECRSTLSCAGEGTNSITVTSGNETATLTFTGVTSTFDVTNQAMPVSLGTFALTASDDFTFPLHTANPELPVVSFYFSLDQSAPVSGETSRAWHFGPGGQAILPLQKGVTSMGLPIGVNPFMYTAIVYTLNPFPFSIAPNGATSFTADVGAVPEPATMVLLGTGLAGIAAARRRRKAAAP